VIGVDSPFADLSKRRQLAQAETRRGSVTLWAAPTKTDERCAWLAFRRREIAVESCLPSAYVHQGWLGARVYLLGGRSIFAGPCGYHAVRFAHRDGSRRTVACIDALVLAVLTPADRAGGIRAQEASGRVVLSEPGPIAPPPGRYRIRRVQTRHGMRIEAVPVLARR
jgi:hypothetical protein